MMITPEYALRYAIDIIKDAARGETAGHHSGAVIAELERILVREKTNYDRVYNEIKSKLEAELSDETKKPYSPPTLTDLGTERPARTLEIQTLKLLD